MGEQEFVDYLAGQGWEVEWISIMEQDESSGTMSQEEAAQWAEEYNLDPASVWFDASQEWMAEATEGAFPKVYTVHTTNMLVWDRSDGWMTPGSADWDGFIEWFPGFFDYAIAQPGA